MREDLAGLGASRATVLEYVAGNSLALLFSDPCMIPMMVGNCLGTYESIEEMPGSNVEYALNNRLEEIVHKWTEKKPAVAEKIYENIIDCLAAFCLPEAHRVMLRTANALERFNGEIRRRTRVVRTFPDEKPALRLIATLAMEQSEDWETLDMSLLEEWSALDDEMSKAVLEMIERPWPFDEPPGPAPVWAPVKV